jgi:hypothetical protein
MLPPPHLLPACSGFDASAIGAEEARHSRDLPPAIVGNVVIAVIV